MSERFFFEQVDDALVVVDLHDWEFASFNGSAAYAWLTLLDGSVPEAELVREMAQAFGVDELRVRADLEPLLADWTRRGWLSRAKDAIGIAAVGTRPDLAHYDSLTPAAFEAATAGTVLGWSGRPAFLGTPVRVALYRHAQPAHPDFLPRARAFLAGIPQSDEPWAGAIECHVTGDAIHLRSGDRCVATRDIVSGLSRLVLWCFYLAYGRSGLLATLHAAAVGKENGMIVMPGISGAGKSTLTAYLAARGWSYGGDDIIGIAQEADEDGRAVTAVLPFPSAISVKAGSVPLLAPFYPGLAGLPEIRYDLKTARFLAMPHSAMVTADRRARTPRAMVFPRHVAGAESRLAEISTTEALTELVASGIRTGETLEATALKRDRKSVV